MRTLRAISLACVIVLVFGSVVPSAQESFEKVSRDFSSPDAGVRLRAVTLLKEAVYLEAAVPLSKLVLDSQDAVQLQAIAAEVNIFLAEKIVPRKRVGGLVEVRNKIDADVAFSAGPLLLGPLHVPIVVLTALRTASRDDNPRVGLEALYAFGELGFEPIGEIRRDLLRSSGPDLASMIGSPDRALRFAAIRVIGRIFERRPDDEPIDLSTGDAVITALNDRDGVIRRAAMEALGSMRYERSVEALTSLFQYYGHGELAEAALDAIARVASPASEPLLESALKSKDPASRMAAIEGLARLGDRSKSPAVEAAFKGARSDRELLAEVFASARLANGSCDDIIESLLRPRLHEQAMEYLVVLAPGHVPMFPRFLMDPDARIRGDVVDVLGLSHDVAALQLLQPMLSDPHPRVAMAVQRAIARLGVEPPKE